MTEIAMSDWPDILKQALKRWHRSAELSQSPLANLQIVEKERESKAYADNVNGRATAVRDVLRRAIQSLGAAGQNPQRLIQTDSGLRVNGDTMPFLPFAFCAACHAQKFNTGLAWRKVANITLNSGKQLNYWP